MVQLALMKALSQAFSARESANQNSQTPDENAFSDLFQALEQLVSPALSADSEQNIELKTRNNEPTLAQLASAPAVEQWLTLQSAQLAAANSTAGKSPRDEVALPKVLPKQQTAILIAAAADTVGKMANVAAQPVSTSVANESPLTQTSVHSQRGELTAGMPNAAKATQSQTTQPNANTAGQLVESTSVAGSLNTLKANEQLEKPVAPEVASQSRSTVSTLASSIGSASTTLNNLNATSHSPRAPKQQTVTARAEAPITTTTGTLPQSENKIAATAQTTQPLSFNEINTDASVKLFTSTPVITAAQQDAAPTQQTVSGVQVVSTDRAQMPPQVAQPTLLSSSVGSQAWQSQLNDSLVQMVMRNQNEMTLHLRPADLGPIQIQLIQDDKATQLHILTHSQQVRGALENALPLLREALQNQGLQLTDSSVNQQQSGWQQSPQQEQQQSARQRHSNTLDLREAAENTNEEQLASQSSSGISNSRVDLYA